MKMQNLNLVYFSATQTTQKVATAFAQGFNADETKVYDFTLPQDRQTAPSFTKNDIVLVGIPVYVGRVAPVFMEYLKALKGNRTPCIVLGVYGNRHYDSCLVELEDILIENGFLPVAGLAFIGEHSFSEKIAKGRPNDEDLSVAMEYGKKVAEKLASMTEVTSLPLGVIPGPRPYKEPFAGNAPIAPIVGETCINCGLCAQHCPMGAINPENVREIDRTKCLKCRRCARLCPVGAIDFNQPPFQKHLQDLINAFGDTPNKPELFI